MLALFLLIPPVPFTVQADLDFERMTLVDAIRNDGQVVCAWFVVAHQPYEIAGLTVIGPDYWDNEERFATLRGSVDVSKGDRVRVRGRLHVDFHGTWIAYRIAEAVKER